MGFQKTVLILALVILSISIIVLSVFISRKDDDKIWPPESSTCPPYYDISYNINGNVFCEDNFGIQDDASTIDISAVVINGEPGNNCKKFYVENVAGVRMNSEQKCSFVEKCKVNWEGWCEKPTYSY